jgi:hypothetical protein
LRRQGELLYAVEWKQFARVLAQWCEIGVDVEKDIYWKALRMVLVPGTHPPIELVPHAPALAPEVVRRLTKLMDACLHLILSLPPSLSLSLHTENEDVVTLERFSAILEWFGPFAKGKKLLQNVVSTIKIKYIPPANACRLGLSGCVC